MEENSMTCRDQVLPGTGPTHTGTASSSNTDKPELGLPNKSQTSSLNDAFLFQFSSYSNIAEHLFLFSSVMG